jgi:hypothetical protein
MLSLADKIMEENIAQIQDILRYGVNLNQIDEYGFTPLIEAAIADNFEIARLLIEYGADVNMQDVTGAVPLHWAAENNNYMLCELLLEKGANPNAYNLAGQPVLVMPVLRQQRPLKKLLQSAGANLDFANDFINTKFLGHLFELVGTANIVDPYNQYVEVDFEGFFLEITLGLIAESLSEFKVNFAGRSLRQYKIFSEIIIEVLRRAEQLMKFQQYQVDLSKHESDVNELLAQEPTIIPVGYEGHAITFIKYGNILVKCDRREESRLYDNVVFYQIKNTSVMNLEFLKNLIYEKQTFEFINQELPTIVNLEPITELKIAAQISGNCSWANVEACVPVLYFLLFSRNADFQEKISRYKNLALDFFHQWREWNKDRALNFCIQSFQEADSIRKACKAEILAAVLFQGYQDDSVRNQARAEKILSVLANSKYNYILQSYIKSYYYEDQSAEGRHFMQLVKSYTDIDQ